VYHLGGYRAFQQGEQVRMDIYLAPNPSHLEWVNPVVEGMARACGEQRDRPGAPEQDERISLPVLIHGDAAFPAQGIVAETLNLYRLPGYRTGGTVHIIANNQIGFTTPPEYGRSTQYASDLAKGFDLPVIHVNADDPEACLTAVRLAHAYRERFLKDVIIDLVGYRRWGHNENDEPAFTQPQMYARIAQHPDRA
jgi:2-oxoglutarate dehydrogenase E1 component